MAAFGGMSLGGKIVAGAAMGFAGGGAGGFTGGTIGGLANGQSWGEALQSGLESGLKGAAYGAALGAAVPLIGAAARGIGRGAASLGRSAGRFSPGVPRIIRRALVPFGVGVKGNPQTFDVFRTATKGVYLGFKGQGTWMQAASRGWARYSQVQQVHGAILRTIAHPMIIKPIMIGYGMAQALSPDAPEILPFAPIHQVAGYLAALGYDSSDRLRDSWEEVWD